MNCLEIEKYMDDFFDRRLSSKLRQQISDHLKTCQHCAQKFRDYEQLILSIQHIECKKCPDEVVDSVFKVLNLDTKSILNKNIFDWINEIIILYWRRMGVAATAAMVVFFLVLLIHSKIDKPSQITQTYSAQEVQQATDQVKLALAYLNEVTNRTEEILEKQVLLQEVFKPMKSSLKTALKPLIEGGKL